MQSPKLNNEIFGIGAPTTSVEHGNLLRIGPWPIKRSRSKNQAFTPANELKYGRLSFSERVVQIDEEYALTRETEGDEKGGLDSLVSDLGDYARVLFVLSWPTSSTRIGSATFCWHF
jgi:hypothetical protein